MKKARIITSASIFVIEFLTCLTMFLVIEGSSWGSEIMVYVLFGFISIPLSISSLWLAVSSLVKKEGLKAITLFISCVQCVYILGVGGLLWYVMAGGAYNG